jgi:hypothetical protein
MKFASFSEGQQLSQNGTITYLNNARKQFIKFVTINKDIVEANYTYIKKNGSQQTTKTPL